MSYEKILNAFTSFGLSREDLRMYVNLAVNGPQTLKTIQRYLQSDCTQVLISIRLLEEKKLIRCVNGKFEATTFDEVLEILVDTSLAEALDVEKNKAAILEHWQAYINQKANVEER
jgi:predicted transcriptional regulator